MLCLNAIVTLVMIGLYREGFSYLQMRSITMAIQILIFASLFTYYRRLKNLQPEPVNIKTENKKDDKKETQPNKSLVNFEQVAGLEEVKEELQEIIDFIKNPEKYHKMGARVPKGILFYGPPGTGKTLLAKAIAGETEASFFPASGSEFVEKYVGVGAKRVRTLFEKAKKETPSIIFIDEIDAIGAKRTIDSNNEKDQTLNQLLIEMDGFHTDQTVIVIGATNRLDLLDEALLRPGRFDRHIYIGNPDVRTREEILKVHTKDKPIDKMVDIRNLAKRTHGMSGAHLANIANEAAILAVRNNKNTIGISEFNEAIEKVIAGLKRKNAVISEKEKRIVAYHEAGHALVGKILNTDCISKVSILPRGEALGYVIHAPNEDKYLATTEELKNRIRVLLGGRAGEQLVCGEISTGARDDLKKATEIAYQMVCEYGMSNLGNRVFEPAFLKNCYEIVDSEIKQIIEECYEDALALLKANMHFLFSIAHELHEKESLTAEELDQIMQNTQSDISSHVGT